MDKHRPYNTLMIAVGLGISSDHIEAFDTGVEAGISQSGSRFYENSRKQLAFNTGVRIGAILKEGSGEAN